MTVTDLTGEHLDDHTVAPLRARIRGTVALPSDPGYARATPWNVAVPVRPAAVVSVADARDVAEAVLFAAAHRLTVAVQATGHGALPVGPSTLLVHTGELSGCHVDAHHRTALVGAGVRWQQVLDAATPFGLAAACGSAPGVGVVGFLTGGGIGPLVRSIGLSSDHVRGFELVTGTGEILWVTPDQHAELFWGLRGGKGTLGIVTAVEIDLLPIPEFYGGALYFGADDAAAVLRAWQGWLAGLPETVTTSVALQQLPPLPGVPEPLAGRFTLAVRFVALGDPAEAEQVLAPLRAVATPLIDTVSVMPYAAIGAVHADPVDPMPVHEGHALLHELTPEAVEALLAVAGPASGSLQVIVELRHLGGAMARPAAHRSAFCHRDAAFSVATIGALMPEIAELVQGHAAAVVDALAPWSTGGALPNFGPSADATRVARCYDEDTLHWLAALAQRYDPAGVFRVGQVARHPL
ncbi:FAD-linked oxidase [Mycolicibacterium murale]|uniref:FAD-linked oxidase n=1 Tax=Mycolicibacterium murale TaxID=182220 RepID=A0A7I9WT27_9MYCO|nr:FAD-binding oxidoreductase [Mycolicibacterium murale]MCV7181660.1 FAD-binding oxidoreductase [Mycolicibacterium murale]GFG60885.1 FAD-linked oxidase [Mycolicibacterium murale]